MNQTDQPVGTRATKHEMAHPDWKLRLGRAQRESRQGKYVTLDEYLQQRALR